MFHCTHPNSYVQALIPSIVIVTLFGNQVFANMIELR